MWSIFATLDNWYERWIFHSYRSTPANLGLYRIVFASAVIAAEPPLFVWITAFPDSFFTPPFGVMRLLHGFPPAGFFYALNLVTLLALVSVLFGHRTRLASLILAAALLVGHGWTYSLGKIDHDAILYVVIALVMAFSSWGSAVSLDGRPARPPSPLPSAWPVCLVMLLTACAMAYAGLVKAASGWLDPRTDAALGHVARAIDASGHTTWLQARLLGAGPLWGVADVAVVALEIGFLIALPWRRAMQVVCACAAIFHVQAYALFVIAPFTANLLAYALLVDWERIWRTRPPRRLAAALQPWAATPRWWHVPGVALALFACNVVVGNPVHAALSLASGNGAEAFFILESAVVATASITFLLLVASRPLGRAAAAAIRALQ
jgi:hypothetical protein